MDMENRTFNALYNVYMTFSQEELSRRHQALKAVMREEGVPAAVVFSRDGAIKSWLLGELCYGFAGAGDILIADGESYSVFDEFLHFKLLDGKEDFSKSLSSVRSKAVKHATNFSFVPILEAMERTKSRRLGIYRPGEMNIDAARYLEDNIPGLEYVDMTEKFDAVHMVRSPEELKFAQNSVDILERAFNAIPSVLAAGLTEYECVNRVRAIPSECALGDQNMYMANRIRLVSNPDGEPMEEPPLCWPGRYMKKGDRVDVEFHCVAENWVYSVVARSFILSDKVSKSTKEKWRIAAGASELASILLRPGTTLKEVAGEVNRWLEIQGSQPDMSCFLYSMFNGVQEQPCLYDYTEDTPLLPGMLIGVCPTARFGDEAPLRCGDVYVVTEEGCRRLGTLPKEILPVKGLL